MISNVLFHLPFSLPLSQSKKRRRDDDDGRKEEREESGLTKWKLD